MVHLQAFLWGSVTGLVQPLAALVYSNFNTILDQISLISQLHALRICHAPCTMLYFVPMLKLPMLIGC